MSSSPTNKTLSVEQTTSPHIGAFGSNQQVITSKNCTSNTTSDNDMSRRYGDFECYFNFPRIETFGITFNDAYKLYYLFAIPTNKIMNMEKEERFHVRAVFYPSGGHIDITNSATLKLLYNQGIIKSDLSPTCTLEEFKKSLLSNTDFNYCLSFTEPQLDFLHIEGNTKESIQLKGYQHIVNELRALANHEMNRKNLSSMTSRFLKHGKWFQFIQESNFIPVGNNVMIGPVPPESLFDPTHPQHEQNVTAVYRAWKTARNAILLATNAYHRYIC